MPTINGKACVANGRNLLTGTVNRTVTGQNTYGHFSGDDLLTLFKGLEGKTVTLSFDYEYSGFVAGSGTNRLGWEVGLRADSTSWFGGWYEPSNDSGSGRMSSTLVVPENITGISEGLGYVQFSGSGTGTLSHFKLEKGSVATPLTPAPVDKVFSDGRQVYGRNLALDTSTPISIQGNSSAWQNIKHINLSQNPAGLTVTYSYAVTIDRPDSGSLYQQFGTNFNPAWGMPISVDFKNLQPGVKTKFNRTIVFPTFIGSGNFNDYMTVGIVSSAALVKFEDLKVVIGDKIFPHSPAPEDILN